MSGATLNIGVTPIEIKESLYQCAPFIGFPRVQEALKIVNEVMLSQGNFAASRESEAN